MARHQMGSISLAFGLLLTVGGPTAAVGQDSARRDSRFAGAPTIDESLLMRTVANPAISPDGRRVVYEISRTNFEDNAFERDLWVADVATGESHRLTEPRKSSGGAAWSPDGRWIAFLSDRSTGKASAGGGSGGAADGKTQVYLIRADAGGDARVLTSAENGINGFSWSPDGKQIAFVTEDSEPKSLHDRRERYGDYAVVRADYVMAHIWLVSVPADSSTALPVPHRMTGGADFSVTADGPGDPIWSHDGTRIAFTAQRDPDIASLTTSSVYVVGVADRQVRKIVVNGGMANSPRWSPDDREIAFVITSDDKYSFYANTRVAVVAAGGGEPRILTAAFDEDPEILEWTQAGLFFSAWRRTERPIFKVDPSTMAVAEVGNTPGLGAFAVSISPDGRYVAYVGDRPNENEEIYVSALDGWAPRKLTSMDAQFASYKTAKREVVNWSSTDGARIEGVLYKPADFDPAKKYPLLVVIHGGPTGIDRPVVMPDRYYPVERFVARGALVLKPNYRGSAGYGGAFRALNVRNLGVGDYADVISGVDALIAKGFVDRERVGAMGWSQGGYISAFITASSDRFKAVSVGAGISDWMTYYVNTDISPFTRQYLHGTPWDDPEIYRKTSPISYVTKARTPTLIQHGELDRRVPIPNAYELRQALEDRGVPVKMVVYKGFGHGITKPKQQRAVMEENERWFGKYIWTSDEH